jgi:hypothetical protein
MTDLSPIMPKLAKLVPRLASDADAEIVSSVRAIDRLLRSNGSDWYDLTEALSPSRPASRARPQPAPQAQRPRTWLEIANFCALCPQAGTLSPKEAEFVLSMVRLLRRYGEPTEKQGKWLRTIFEKLGGVQ